MLIIFSRINNISLDLQFNNPFIVITLKHMGIRLFWLNYINLVMFPKCVHKSAYEHTCLTLLLKQLINKMY